MNNNSDRWYIHKLAHGGYAIRGIYENKVFRASICRQGKQFQVNINGHTYGLSHPMLKQVMAESIQLNQHGNTIHAPMAGTVKDILVKNGTEVEIGQLLCRLESMKLLMDITAHQAGVAQSCRFQEGQRVAAGDILMEINKND